MPSRCLLRPPRRTRRSSRATSRSARSARSRPTSRSRASTSSGCTGAAPEPFSSGLARWRAAGTAGWTRRRRTRTSPTWARTSARAWLPGGSGTPGGSDRPTGSSTACAARSHDCARTSSGARPRECPRERSRSAGAPPIVPRSGWNADETIRRSTPSIAPAIRLAVVHHTAGANGYTAAQSPSIVRAIELYHVKGNGWNDIGYNFLVDRFGTVFEGRYGGIDRNVVGAHAEGFNTGSVGVSVLGEYSSLPASPQARESLAKLLAWRLDLAHVDPASTLSFISGGNARFPAGLPVFLRTVSGHRDVGFSDCPGTALYNLLNGITGEVAKLGLPKLYAPVVTGTSPAPFGSRRASRRRFPGPSTSATRPGTPLPRRRDSARTSTGAGTRHCFRPEATPTRSARRTASRPRPERSEVAAAPPAPPSA